MFRTILVALIAAFALTGPSSSSFADGDHRHEESHDRDTHDHKKSDNHGAKHGGLFVETATHHGVEMVLSDTSLVFHISEDHEPLKVDGSKFKAVVQTDAGTRVVELEAKDTTLTAVLNAPLPKGAKIALTGKDPHGAVIQARFVTK